MHEELTINMMKLIPLDTNEHILEFLSLQLTSYRVEAELIGFQDIPPLKDGIESIREAKETFIGYYVEADNIVQLAGAISYERDGSVVTICRMMVHPNHFRKGIASKMLEYVILNQQKEGASRIMVSTGTLNTPALALYRSFGFMERSVRTVAPGVQLTTLERPAVI
jgi:GNAT superfamily N-acetyltransferase